MLSVLVCVLVAVQTAASAVQTGYVPERVYDTRRQAFSDFEAMLADLAGADVVVVGEQHDDANTHRLEAAILEGLRRRNVPVIVSLEMFERDVQSELDAYLKAGRPEEQFLKASRPWPRYQTDYRPLVEIAKAQGWPVVASNTPRKYSSGISKSGFGILEGMSAADRAFVAADLQCPHDSYYDRFITTMNDHPAPGTEKLSADDRRDMNERYYLAQCTKDETMAESIAVQFAGLNGSPGTIVHFNGAFHSDFGTGAAARVRRRLPGRRVIVVSILPVKDLDSLAPTEEDLRRAEYLVYTVK
jgi:uncharacterized iron-regulated protein